MPLFIPSSEGAVLATFFSFFVGGFGAAFQEFSASSAVGVCFAELLAEVCTHALFAGFVQESTRVIVSPLGPGPAAALVADLAT